MTSKILFATGLAVFITSSLIGVGAIYATSGSTAETRTEVEIEMVKTKAPEAVSNSAPVKLTTKKITSIKVSPEQVVYFDMEVNRLSVDVAISMLTTMSNKYKDVYLLINSPGGSVFDGKRLIAFIESSSNNVHTVCVFLCASMAAHLHQSGKTRLFEDSGILMFHPASGSVRGQVENMVSQLNFIQNVVNELDAKASARSNIPYDEFKRRVAYEFWINPTEALDVKLTDKLVYVRTSDPKKPRGQSVFEEVLKKDPMAFLMKNKNDPKITLEN